MPFTPYHFGPSGFIGLLFRRWIDLPVFLLANVIIDLEVLVTKSLEHRWPIHRYLHTLLIGAVAGAVFGFVAYSLRRVFKKIMKTVNIPYQTSLLKMVLSGILGMWLHVFIDAIYHPDVRIFWPSSWRGLYGLIGKGEVITICLVSFLAAAICYIYILTKRLDEKKNV